MSEAKKWDVERLEYLRGLKSPTDHQRLLLVLADKAERTGDEDRKLAALLKAERAADRAQRAKAAAAKLLNADREAERKARTRRLIELGGLVELAGLGERDKGALLGALLALAKTSDAERWAGWKAAGDAALAQRKH